MRLKTLALLVLALLFIALVGCEHSIAFVNPAEKRRESINDLLSGDVIGDIGKSYTTRWFEFTVHSIDKADAHLGYKAQEDHLLYKVQVTLKSVWDDAIPMGTFDFYMDDTDFQEYIWAIPPLDNTMMPEEFIIQPGASVQYLMVFEVPTGTTELALLYTENNENGIDGKSFVIYIDS